MHREQGFGMLLLIAGGLVLLLLLSVPLFLLQPPKKADRPTATVQPTSKSKRPARALAQDSSTVVQLGPVSFQTPVHWQARKTEQSNFLAADLLPQTPDSATYPSTIHIEVTSSAPDQVFANKQNALRSHMQEKPVLINGIQLNRYSGDGYALTAKQQPITLTEVDYLTRLNTTTISIKLLATPENAASSIPLVDALAASLTINQ